MGKRLLIIIAVTSLMVGVGKAQDIVNINYDEKTLEQLTLNTEVQVATNDLHNRQVDTIKNRQTRLMELVTGIAAEKELLIATYKNVSGFKKESKYYTAMAAVGLDIINHSAKALEVINKSKLSGKAIVIINLSDLVAQAVGLGKVFADIVANSEVANPVKKTDDTSGGKDKYNLLNRHERLQLANKILRRLKSIDRTICYLTYLAKKSDWKDVLKQMDRQTYATLIMTRVRTNQIINKWNQVKK